MNLKTFTAESMPAALAMVKRELGSQAMILHTRTYKRGGLWGLGAKTVVEITAADGSKMKGAAGPRRSSPPHAARATPRAAEATVEPTAGDLIRKTYAAAKMELSSQTRTHASHVPEPAMVPAGSGHSQLSAELREVRAMVEQLMRQQSAGATDHSRRPPAPHGRASQGHAQAHAATSQTPAVPGRLKDQYQQLLEQEVARELAESIMQDVRQTLTPRQLEDEALTRNAVLRSLTRVIPTDTHAGGIEPTTDGRPRTIALIGPTGVGKTTTIAKLAATFKLRQKKNVALITLDTYRIAAVDQLKTYAQILSLPLHVALSPQELVTALEKCAGADVVLIDTAGRSQKDDPRLEQLASFIEAANPHEVHLVLSSTCTQPVLLQTVERFSKVRTDKIIFTKLDEAVSFGVVVNVITRVKKELSYVTTGQEVPNQIEPGRPARIAELVLGGGL